MDLKMIIQILVVSVVCISNCNADELEISGTERGSAELKTIKKKPKPVKKPSKNNTTTADPNAAKPFICTNPVERVEAVKLGSEIATIVNGVLTLNGLMILDETTRTRYTDFTGRVMTALQNGWAKPDVTDAISSAVADPLNEFPIIGPGLAAGIKPILKVALDMRKRSLGC